MCGDCDFCKPQMPNSSVAASTVWYPTLRALHRDYATDDQFGQHEDVGDSGVQGSAAAATSARFVLELSVPVVAHRDYGAPESVTIDVNISAAGSKQLQLQVAVLALNKTTCRLPEAAFVSFAPDAVVRGAGRVVTADEVDANISTGGVEPKESTPAADGLWSHEVLGGVVNNSVVSHGSTHLHGAEAVRWASSSSEGDEKGRGDASTAGNNGSDGVGAAERNTVSSFRVESLDAGLLCYGEPTAFPTPFSAPNMSFGTSFNLWNNVWGTNYPQWCVPKNM